MRDDVVWPHALFSVLLSQPFHGPLAITPESFEHSIVVYNSVDAGN